MNKEVMGKCPVCSDELVVTRLSCSSCKSVIEGEFSLCNLCKLSEEQKDFINIFIKSRGNIKEIEKEMGISYPTVRGKLENIIENLKILENPSEKKLSQKEILTDLSSGKITTDQALLLLKD